MPKHYVILGGGISGLSLAWSLQKHKGVAVTLVEREPRLGGWIETLHTGGFLFDRGPHSCRAQGVDAGILQLIDELDLQDEVISASPEASRRYLYVNKNLHALPNGPVSALLSPLTRGLFKAFWRDLRTFRGPGCDESVAAFVERRLGQGFAERLFDPLVSGIFAGDCRALSLRACFPLLAEWEEKCGGLVRGMIAAKKGAKNTIFSFRKGMETLPHALAERFEGDLYLKTAVKALDFAPSCAKVRLSDGKTLEADRLFSALPAAALGVLLSPHHSALANSLKQISCASVAVVNLGYRKRLLKRPGFGYLIPSSEGESVLGVLFDSCAFPQQANHPEETRLTVMIGGARMRDFDTWTHEQFVASAQEALSRHLGIDEAPDAVAVKKARHAIPQYLVGHLDRTAAIEREVAAYFPRLTLLGSSFYGISVTDCIKVGIATGAQA